MFRYASGCVELRERERVGDAGVRCVHGAGARATVGRAIVPSLARRDSAVGVAAPSLARRASSVI